MSIREAFSTLEISAKQQIALEATLKGVDLETVFTMLDTAVELLKPLYEKNLAALGALPPAATNAPVHKEVDLTKEEMAAGRDGDWRTAIGRCPECGAHISPSEACLIDNLCHACWDDHRPSRELECPDCSIKTTSFINGRCHVCDDERRKADEH